MRELTKREAIIGTGGAFALDLAGSGVLTLLPDNQWVGWSLVVAGIIVLTWVVWAGWLPIRRVTKAQRERLARLHKLVDAGRLIVKAQTASGEASLRAAAELRRMPVNMRSSTKWKHHARLVIDQYFNSDLPRFERADSGDRDIRRQLKCLEDVLIRESESGGKIERTEANT